MSLNRFMHPRNPYKGRKPNFQQLIKSTNFFDEFKDSVDSDIKLDLSSIGHLTALAKALLKLDFNLTVDFCPDRLVPTIPLRLNYILWLEDILAAAQKPGHDPVILDIGVGAACIYPLLGVARNPAWKFIGSEIDLRSYEFALKNVQANNLEDKIKLLHVAPESSPLECIFNPTDSLFAPPSHIDLVMSNPPFFSDTSEAVGAHTTRNERRNMPSSASSAARHESQAPGGEVYFTFRLAKDSLKYKDRIGVVTVMLGKKSSVRPVKRMLLKLNIRNVSVYELCQGRVMRWGVAWTLHENVSFPVSLISLSVIVKHVQLSEFKAKRKMERKPLTLPVPENLECSEDYSVDGIIDRLRQEFRQLGIKVLDQKNRSDVGGIHLLISSRENTWIHARRRRRELARMLVQQSAEAPTAQSDPQPDTNGAQKRRFADLMQEEMDQEAQAKRRCLINSVTEEAQAWLEHDDQSHALDQVVEQGNPDRTVPLLLANVFVERTLARQLSTNGDSSGDLDENASSDSEDDDNPANVDEDSAVDETPIRFIIKFHNLNPDKRDVLHQLILYLKNRLV